MESLTVLTDDGVALHVDVCGQGPPVVVLSGGPGCVHYLAQERLAPAGFRTWFPHPRGVGPSSGGPHDMERAVADLEVIRQSAGVESWIVIGHSWGSDLGVRYAMDYPQHVSAVVGIAGHGFHRDRDWSAAYKAGKALEEPIPIDFVPEVHASLSASFRTWIHEPLLWRRVADCEVAMTFVAAGADIRPSWPLQQLAALAPHGSYRVVSDVGHDFWSTHPNLWQTVCTQECSRLGA